MLNKLIDVYTKYQVAHNRIIESVEDVAQKERLTEKHRETKERFLVIRDKIMLKIESMKTVDVKSKLPTGNPVKVELPASVVLPTKSKSKSKKSRSSIASMKYNKRLGKRI